MCVCGDNVTSILNQFRWSGSIHELVCSKSSDPFPLKIVGFCPCFMGFPGISDREMMAMCTRIAAFPRSQVHKKIKVRPPAGPEAPGDSSSSLWVKDVVSFSMNKCYVLFFTSIFAQIRWDHSHNSPVIVHPEVWAAGVAVEKAALQASLQRQLGRTVVDPRYQTDPNGW